MRLCLTLFTRAHRTLAAFERGCQMAGVEIVQRLDMAHRPQSVYLVHVLPAGPEWVIAPKCRMQVEPEEAFWRHERE